MNNELKQEFREDEVALIRHWDKARNEWITNVFPKIGGRLRMAHEQNETITIETEIYKYDENIAVVIGTCRTVKGCFKGIGMSSVARDQKIAPAILELAETRSIARALRFAGFGVEYCSAEEVSHLENGNSAQPREDNGPRPKANKQIDHQAPALPAPDIGNEKAEGVTGRVEKSFQPVDTTTNVYRPKFNAIKGETPAQSNGNGNASASATSNGDGSGKERLSNKQYQYILNLTKNKNITREELNQLTVERYGVYCDFMNRSEASSFIQELQGH